MSYADTQSLKPKEATLEGTPSNTPLDEEFEHQPILLPEPSHQPMPQGVEPPIDEKTKEAAQHSQSDPPGTFKEIFYFF